MASYSVYIVECRDGSLYTGIAVDVERRLKEHESGPRGAKYLRSRAPLALKFSATVGDRGTALRIEARIKKLSRQGKLDLIAGRRALSRLKEECQVPVETSPV